MKRQRSFSTSGRTAKKPKYQRQDATVTAVVRKELRKKTDWRYTDAISNGGSVTTTGTITSCLSNLTRGDNGLNNFSGNEIRPQAVLIQYYFQTNQTYNSVRFMVFQWFDAGAPAVGGVLQDGGTNIATISPVVVTNKRYIKVLYDKTHLMAPTAGGDNTVIGNGVVQPVKIYIPGKRLRPVRYNQNNNTCQDGNIFILTISDDALTTFPSVYWFSRVTFSDGS